jgi:predicted N-acyltransferase
MKKAQSSGLIEVKITTDIKNIIEDIYRLYLNTYNASSVKFEKLTKEFFLNITSYMPSQAKFFLYYLDGKLAAFNLCFVYKDALIDKFIGFDYEMAYKYNLYFFSWCYNIKWCIENCVRYYQVGQTDYYPKLKLGGRIVPLYAYVKHNNPIQNLILKLLAKILRPPGLYENLKSNA